MQRCDAERADAERGFGLVEVLVSMMLLMIVALSLLPVYVTALKLSASNVSMTTATQLVSEQMDVARQLASTCRALKEFVAQTSDITELDPQGRTLVVHRSTDVNCPSPYPGVMSFSAWVGYQGSSVKLAYAQTSIHISGSGY